MDVQMEDASPVRAQERNSNVDTPNQSQSTTPALPPISSLPSLPPLPPAPSTHGTQGASSQPLAPFPSATSASAPSVSTPAAAAAPATQPDPAKLEALRRATLNSYKNRFLNLRDKFDRVNAVSFLFSHHSQFYHTFYSCIFILTVPKP